MQNQTKQYFLCLKDSMLIEDTRNGQFLIALGAVRSVYCRLFAVLQSCLAYLSCLAYTLHR